MGKKNQTGHFKERVKNLGFVDRYLHNNSTIEAHTIACGDRLVTGEETSASAHP